MKDSIDFGKEKIPVLFRKIFVPTLFGMLFQAFFVIVDGIFVGKGIGSNGLASVNVVAPLFMFFMGTALMFGIGGSVVISIHLSKNKHKAANINFTQSMTVVTLLISIIIVLILLFREQIAYLFGASEMLLPMVLEYMNTMVPFAVCNIIGLIGVFFIRIDGSPKYAMSCSVIAAALNIFLDYLFIFPFGWGLKGAALATGLSYTVGALMVLGYFTFAAKTLHFYKPKFSKKSIKLTIRNVKYMVTLGFSALISESSIAFIAAIGNNVFMDLLGEDGLAAFSVICYLFPLVSMTGNAIGQSAQPIISYNKGAGIQERVRKTLRISIRTGIIVSLVIASLFFFMNEFIVQFFLDPSYNSYNLAVTGVSCFSLAVLFFIFNIVIYGFCQSIEKYKPATVIILLRGYVFTFAFFMILPKLFGSSAAWFSIPAAEIVTTVIILTSLMIRKIRK